MRTPIRIGLVVFLVVSLALPALAGPFDTGTTNCVLHEQVRIRSDSTGTTEHSVLYPYKLTGMWNNGVTYKIRYSNSGREDATWFVEVTNGALSDPGTYGYCYPHYE